MDILYAQGTTLAKLLIQKYANLKNRECVSGLCLPTAGTFAVCFYLVKFLAAEKYFGRHRLQTCLLQGAKTMCEATLFSEP
jgi:hypothetical protein